MELILTALSKSNAIDSADYLKFSGYNLGLNILRAGQGSDVASAGGLGVMAIATGLPDVQKVFDEQIGKNKEQMKEAVNNKRSYEERVKAGEKFRIRTTRVSEELPPMEGCFPIMITSHGRTWACPLREGETLDPFREGLVSSLPWLSEFLGDRP